MTQIEAKVAYELHKFMDDRKIIMSFLGDLNHKVVTSILISVKRLLSMEEADFLVKKKLYAVLVECLDNITKHNIANTEGQPETNKNPSTLFTLSLEEDHFKILTGNYIFNSNIESLSSGIEELNGLNKEGLQSLYRKKLLESKSEGGGLGMIDISLRSGCKFTYEIRPMSDQMSFFILQAIVNK
ncbi:MAG: hypothetical protein IAF38_09340 [Bacteroidia bacterium]|nr:hypothetical protein [Bacteroidia bacterium]